MSIDEIFELAQSVKNIFKTTNALEICRNLNIEINYTNLKPNLYPAYTLKCGKKPAIVLNKHFTLKSQNILCAHELGHVLMHDKKLLNQFNDTNNGIEEYEANLFAVSLLFNQEDLNFNIKTMDNYILKGLLMYNMELIPA